MVEIGIIGMGDMGKMYAKRLGQKYRINACDLPSKTQALMQEFEGTSINVLADGHMVSRRSDYIIYSVEAEHIDKIVATYGPCKLTTVIADASYQNRRHCRRPDKLQGA